ncbi:MAG: PaaI family thioesterase [Bacillaceae bacterium]|nr:PaaI family thioesterase [Bacillaceae bacterium]
MSEQDREALLKHLHDEMKALSKEELAQIQHVIGSLKKNKEETLHYLGHFLGIDIRPDGDVFMHLGMHNSNTYGNAQGGALYTLADVAIGYRILDGLEAGEKVYTLEMKVNYLKPGQGNRLRARPEIVHQGRKTVVGQCRIEDEQGDLVAQALGTFYIVRSR